MILLLWGFILLIIISGLLVFQEESKEPFSSNTVMVLLGDSVLKNESYVQSGLSVSEYLKSKVPSTYSYALNDSTIVDVYHQLGQIPLDYNHPNCCIFFSVGGNDILSNHVENIESLRPIFIAYTKLIRSIKTRMDKSKLFLVNIYYPSSLKYSQYTPILAEWNKMIDDYAYNSANNIAGVVRLNEILKEKSDFTHEIEPSESGGLKVAEAILKSI
jgi:lysophospholipase L1-like esterase